MGSMTQGRSARTRRIGALPGKDANGAFPKTYYVGDIVTAKPADQPAVREGSTLGAQHIYDLTPLVDLIETTVAPGTWVVQDDRGNELPPRANRRGATTSTRQNVMVPFFLTISIVIRCPKEAHDEIASLLRNLRRLKSPYAYDEHAAGDTRITIALPDSARAKPPFPPRSSNDRMKKIDELMKSLQDEIQKLDDGKATER